MFWSQVTVSILPSLCVYFLNQTCCVYSVSIYSWLPDCLISEAGQFLILPHTLHYLKKTMKKRGRNYWFWDCILTVCMQLQYGVKREECNTYFLEPELGIIIKKKKLLLKKAWTAPQLLSKQTSSKMASASCSRFSQLNGPKPHPSKATTHQSFMGSRLQSARLGTLPPADRESCPQPPMVSTYASRWTERPVPPQGLVGVDPCPWLRTIPKSTPPKFSLMVAAHNTIFFLGSASSLEWAHWPSTKWSSIPLQINTQSPLGLLPLWHADSQRAPCYRSELS